MCKERPAKKHQNSKWCAECAQELARRPNHNLTQDQIREVKKRLHKMPKGQICSEVGISWSALGRWARDAGVRVAYFNRWAASPEFVRIVCDYYAKHGKKKTKEHFPDIKLRSIVERYPHEKRQVRWTEAQIRELAQMGGLITKDAQARYFSRPNANRGSIVSVWMKRFGVGGRTINGLSWDMAKHLVNGRCRPIKTKFWSPRDERTKRRTSNQGRYVVLWVDLEKHLRRDQPEWVRETVTGMARFQRWLHGTDRVRDRVISMIREREGK